MRERLSKSRFIAGWQCPLRLWYRVHRPGLATPPDAATQARFDEGHRVGELARERYPGGVLVAEDHRDVRRAVARTDKLLADPGVPALYEAAFVHEDVLIRVDVLRISGTVTKFPVVLLPNQPNRVSPCGTMRVPVSSRLLFPET